MQMFWYYAIINIIIYFFGSENIDKNTNHKLNIQI